MPVPTPPNSRNPHAPTRRHPRYLAEPLEPRTLLAAFAWSNRNDFTGDTDNRFDDVFGPNTATAIAVVDAALTTWTRLITSFNYPAAANANDTYTISISMAPNGTSLGANAGGSSNSNSGGKPITGSMTIGRGNDGPDTDTDINGDGTPDPVGDGLGWYLDPTPLDNSEFTANPTNAFAAYAAVADAPFGQADFFNVILHELGHALGLGSSPAINARATDTGQGDSISSNPAIANYWRVDGFFSGSRGLWTGFDSGGQGGAFNANGAQHHAPPGAVYTNPATGITYRGADDLMTPFYSTGQRRFPSRNDLDLLRDTYAYTTRTPDTFGTAYGTLDANGTLRVTMAATGADTIDIEVFGPTLQLAITPGTPNTGADPDVLVTTWPLSSISAITISTFGGADVIRLPTFAGTPIPITVLADTGGDDLYLTGRSGNDTVTLNTTTLTASGINVSHGGIDNFFFTKISGNTDLFLPGSANANFSFNGAAVGESITLHSASATLGVVIINANAGNDTITLAPENTPLAVAADLFIFGGPDDDTLNLAAGNLDAVSGFVAFDGGTGFNDSAVLNDQLPALFYTYTITPSLVTRNPFFGGLNYANLDNLTINAGPGANTFVVTGPVSPTLRAFGNDGPDTFVFGGGNLTGLAFPYLFSGGNGVDTLTFDDQNDPTARIWDVRPNEVAYGGLVVFDTTSFESVSVLAGAGNDDIHFFGNLRQNLTVHGGAGSNTFTWHAANNWYRNPVGGAIESYAVDLTGGATALNTLVVLDATRADTAYTIASDRFDSYDFSTQNTGPNFTYHAFLSFTVHASDFSNAFDVTSTTLVAYALNGNGDADSFRVATGPAATNSVSVNGGPGANSLFVDDSFSPDTLPATYTVNTSSVRRTATTDAGPVALQVTFSSIASLAVAAAAGDDILNLTQISPSLPVSLNGAIGNDTYNLSAPALTAAALTVNDSDSLGTLNFNDQSTSAAVPYNSFATPGSSPAPGDASSTANASTPYSGIISRDGIQIPYSGISLIVINAGSGNDSLAVSALPIGTQLWFYGNAGDDALGTPSFNLKTIEAPLLFDGGTGANDRLQLFDLFDTTGITAHLDQSTLGAYPGDSLFPPGAALTFYNTDRLDLSLSPHPDTLFVQPNTFGTRLILDAAGPTSGPGDAITLALAYADNYALTPTSPSAGFLTADNTARLDFSGFESAPTIDDTAPLIATASLSPTSLDYTFTEPLLSVAYPILVNLYNPLTFESTNVLATYDAPTATLSLPTTTLPAGLYTATLYAPYVYDAAGNATPFDFTFTFIHVPAAQSLTLPDSPSAYIIEALHLAPTATLDLGASSLIIDYTPSTGNPSPHATITALLQSAVTPDFTWTSPGITSSTARAFATHQLPGPLTTLALAESATYTLRNNTTLFANITIDDTALLIKHTYAADATLDGQVNDTDVDLLYANYQDSRRPQDYTPFVTTRTFTDADFTYDGLTDDRDLDLLASTINPLAPTL